MTDDRWYDEEDALLALYEGLVASLDRMPPTSEWWPEISQLRERVAPKVPGAVAQWDEEAQMRASIAAGEEES